MSNIGYPSTLDEKYSMQSLSRFACKQKIYAALYLFLAQFLFLQLYFLIIHACRTHNCYFSHACIYMDAEATTGALTKGATWRSRCSDYQGTRAWSWPLMRAPTRTPSRSPTTTLSTFSPRCRYTRAWDQISAVVATTSFIKLSEITSSINELFKLIMKQTIDFIDLYIKSYRSKREISVIW